MTFGSWDITEYEIKKWAKLYLEENIPLREIAKRYNRSLPTIQHRLRLIGAYPKYKAKEKNV